MVEVRVVGADDWEVWREVRLRALRESPGAFGSTYDDVLTQPEEWFRARLGGDGIDLLAFADGTPVAMGGGFPDRAGWLRVVSMWVEPQWRGRRVGALVLSELAEHARERGLRLHLDVAVGNDGARRAYERQGFVATGETGPLRPGSQVLLERMVLRE